MKIKILIDNISDDKSLDKEWGLSVYTEFNGKKFLLDTGHSKKFSRNAKNLGVNLSEVEYGILSHAHYDHSDGLDHFFKLNKYAKFFIRDSVKENCYHMHRFFNFYIGIKKGILKKYRDRFTYVSGDYNLCDGVYLIPNKAPDLYLKGKAARLGIKTNGRVIPDDFKHEQSLVFDTDKGLVIMNSCSHAGADNIITDIQNTFPEKKIYAILGGFHLFCLPDKEINAFAERLSSLGVQHIYTGHCTGQHAFDLLKNVLGEKVQQLKTGLTLDF